MKISKEECCTRNMTSNIMSKAENFFFYFINKTLAES